nr:MAG TPA: hypothetical protein [Caudoviricetes sp.]
MVGLTPPTALSLLNNLQPATYLLGFREMLSNNNNNNRRVYPAKGV